MKRAMLGGVLAWSVVGCQWLGSYDGTRCDDGSSCGGEGSGYVCVANVCRLAGVDAGSADASVDAGPAVDAGEADGGNAGFDAGFDAGSLDAGPCLLWLVGNVGVTDNGFGVVGWANQCSGGNLNANAVKNDLGLGASYWPQSVDGGVSFGPGMGNAAPSLDVAIADLPTTLTVYFVGRSGSFAHDAGSVDTDLIGLEVRQPGTMGAPGTFWNLYVRELSSNTQLGVGKGVGTP